MKGIATLPVAALVAFRWPAWLIALIGVITGAGADAHGVTQELLLGVTALILLAETVLAWRPALRPPGWGDEHRLLLLVAAVDVVVGLVAVYLSGGWRSPFYHYAVTALLLPSFLLPLGVALLWGGTFVLAYLGVCLNDDGWDGDIGSLLSRRIGQLATPLLVVIVVWYFARLIDQRQRAHEAAQYALAETAALVDLSEAMAANLTPLDTLVDAVVDAAARSGLFRTFAISVIDPANATAAERGFDGGDVGTIALPLTMRGETLGTLTIAPAEGVSFAGAGAGVRVGDEFLETLARQTALGVYDARLFAQREELATQAERARIAREIHDGMAQSLYMLSLGLEACVDAAQGQSGELARRLAALVGVSQQALWEARRYIFDLTPVADGERSLVVMLENLTREFETASRVPTTLVIEGDPRPAPAAVIAPLYRISQEALANVFKHALARHVTVTVAFGPDTVRITVIDDGCGIREDAAGGYGLANMRRRAEEAGGVIQVGRPVNGGTMVRVDLPSRPVVSTVGVVANDESLTGR